MKIYEIVVNTAKDALKTQRKNGSMPPGHNGPYHDKETPVRNTGHWLISFIKAFEISKNILYRNAAEKAGSYLLSEMARPRGYTFFHRTKKGKDSCNGLIGQAWSIEALVTAYTHFNNPSFEKAAIETFLLHDFDTNRGLWHVRDIDGTKLSIDGTLNHQIWFAMAGSLILNPDIQKQVEIFLNLLPQNMQINTRGLILHSVRNKKNLRTLIHKLLKCRKGVGGGIYKATGYHQFNLYALAALKQRYPDHRFWKSTIMQKALQYARSDIYKNELEENKYGYPYNVAGFEMAFVLQEFILNSEQYQKEWIKNQLDYTKDNDSFRLTKNTEDTETLTARIYEVTRLSNLEVPIPA